MSANFDYSLTSIATPEKTSVVNLQGEIDESNQQKLIDLLEELLVSPSKNVVFNIKHLEYINSGVIGIFANYHSQFIDAGKEFVFAEANEHIFDIIDLVGLTTVITLFPNNEEACVSFED